MPLWLRACEEGESRAVVRAAISSNAKVNFMDAGRLSPLMLACGRSDDWPGNVVCELLSADALSSDTGAMVIRCGSVARAKSLVDPRDVANNTPLLLCC